MRINFFIERWHQLMFTLLPVFRPVFEIDDIHRWEGTMFICCVSGILHWVHALSNTVLPEDRSLHFLDHSGLFSTALSRILQDFSVT